ncbi:DUF6624 domain-containing protein [Tellurirhabdus rosea]|uniref:DUF6624 domain-containing protein n=1 Tax=Tellurirhabdus rosea TaxID=2674997 RepID=UPI00224D7546|nr:DUF6624 domain-containing protein [Tellurirhabdus rosea]
MKKLLFFIPILTLMLHPAAAQRNQRTVNAAEVRNQLTKIYDKDQKERARYDELERQFGWGAKESQDARNKIKEMDRQHLKEIEQIIEQTGSYPGRALVGQPLDQVAFLIIQHSTDRAVHEKYLPMITAAAQKGDIDKASAAILTDQVKVQKGEKQVYGTQIRVNNSGEKELYPVEDMASLNQRRKEMDLEPMEVYLRKMGVKQ